MKRVYSAILCIIMATTLASCSFAGGQGKMGFNKEPVTLELWHYYNSIQKSALDKMIAEFNNTVGQEQGIIVQASNRGNISELTDAVMAAADKKVGSDAVPHMFTAYADTAFLMDNRGLVVDMGEYFTDEELQEYTKAYIDEGLMKDAKFKIFPIGKSTEIMMLNKTDWDEFSNATGVGIDTLATNEDLVVTAKKYYEYTDAKTPDIKDDGKALFGRDAMANYMLIGCKQLGIEIFEVDDQSKVTFNLDKTVLRQLWDNFYVPFINGYFASNGRFRSDDAKVGQLIALVGSTTSATFFPTEVIINDKPAYPIECIVLQAPKFKNGENFAVLQGAGVVITKTDERQEKACATFLKWFTEVERNVVFSTLSSYLPVKIGANDPALMQKAMEEGDKEYFSDYVKKALNAASQTANSATMYTNRAFEGGTQARKVLDNSMVNIAKENAQSVENLVQGGMSRSEAAKTYDTDEIFEAWLKSLEEELMQTQKR